MTMMDEIICPACGRPNLTEAEKCWYCQVTLAKTDSADSKQEEPSKPEMVIPQATPNSGNLFSNEDQSENIPDWLKRIRELKKADQPVEEENQWQQEKLFAGIPDKKSQPAKHAESSSRAVKKPETTESELTEPQGQPLLTEAPEIEASDPSNEPESDSKTNLLDEELPEGFTPFKNGKKPD